MNIHRLLGRASALGLFVAAGMPGAAHAYLSTAACTPAVQGNTLALLSNGACAAADHLSIHFADDIRHQPLLVEQATADSLVLSYAPAAGSYSFGGSGFHEQGEVFFGPYAAVKPAEGFVVKDRTMKAYVTATVVGQGNLDWAVFAVNGAPTTKTYEKTLVLDISPQDDLNASLPMRFSYYAPYSQGINGAGSVYSTVSFSVDKIVYSASVVAVPEPATWGLMMLGLAGVAVARRHKKF